MVDVDLCVSCGAIGRKVTINLDGETVHTFFACTDCFEHGKQKLARLRPVFDAMLKCGVSRDHANETMTYLLELEEYP